MDSDKLLRTMAYVNRPAGQIQVRIVYAGGVGSGRRTNLEALSRVLPASTRTELTQRPIPGGLTVEMDVILPSGPRVDDLNLRLALVALTGPSAPEALETALQTADGVVLVVDSAVSRFTESRELLQQVEDALQHAGLSFQQVPLTIQYNKRDLADAVEIDQLQTFANPYSVHHQAATATAGEGVLETLRIAAERVAASLLVQLTGDKDAMPTAAAAEGWGNDQAAEQIQQMQPEPAAEQWGHIDEDDEDDRTVVSNDRAGLAAHFAPAALPPAGVALAQPKQLPINDEPPPIQYQEAPPVKQVQTPPPQQQVQAPPVQQVQAPPPQQQVQAPPVQQQVQAPAAAEAQADLAPITPRPPPPPPPTPTPTPTPVAEAQSSNHVDFIPRPVDATNIPKSSNTGIESDEFIVGPSAPPAPAAAQAPAPMEPAQIETNDKVDEQALEDAAVEEFALAPPGEATPESGILSIFDDVSIEHPDDPAIKEEDIAEAISPVSVEPLRWQPDPDPSIMPSYVANKEPDEVEEIEQEDQDTLDEPEEIEPLPEDGALEELSGPEAMLEAALQPLGSMDLEELIDESTDAPSRGAPWWLVILLGALVVVFGAIVAMDYLGVIDSPDQDQAPAPVESTE